jgi:acylpyruvate hydrolase
MKLATYKPNNAAKSVLGVAIAANGAECLLNLGAAAQAAGATAAPADMIELVEAGEAGLKTVRQLVDLAERKCADQAVAAEWLSKGVLCRVADLQFLPPIKRPGKIIMIGGNYKPQGADHHDRSHLPPALLGEKKHPNAFAKYPSVMVGHDRPIIYPKETTQLDYEAELCVVIGVTCKDVPVERAMDTVFGYMVTNDVSMRDLQWPEMLRGSTMLGKNLDTALPAGPYLVTKDEVPDPHGLTIKTWVNRELRQSDVTSNMVFSIAQIISFYSQMTLEPGDMICTGSPSGVGYYWTPREHGLLHIGDVVEIEIEKVGRLSNRIVAEG